MASQSLRSLLDFAVEISWAAGKLVLRRFQTGLAAELKADLSPVTEADREAESLCRERIEQMFPKDGIVGEEFGISRPEAPRRWIIDPIDGTRSFVRGVPLFGVLIALEEGEEVLLGVLHFPALTETVSAARGEGCWWNGKRAEVSSIERLEEAAILTTDAERMKQRQQRGYDLLRKQAGLVRTWGDCYGHALVATGRAEVMLDPVAAVWDAAALRPVIEEAGGVFTDWTGRRTHRGGSAVSTNARLSEAVRAVLA